ncbi:unnamed protein product [Ranitomeya imitator]|uniref:Prolactin receptor n=1 Tax=Ranitomeya imitator TaxID=111125 RepID=A0ABN9MIZ9_9NEOB|nr:unnamed protein product [Ranitomeya imitator]
MKKKDVSERQDFLLKQNLIQDLHCEMGILASDVEKEEKAHQSLLKRSNLSENKFPVYEPRSGGITFKDTHCKNGNPRPNGDCMSMDTPSFCHGSPLAESAHVSYELKKAPTSCSLQEKPTHPSEKFVKEDNLDKASPTNIEYFRKKKSFDEKDGKMAACVKS